MNLIFSIKRIVKKILFAANRNAFREFNSFLVNNNGILSIDAPIDLEKCCIMIESLQLNYRLTDGTILGIYRDGRLIPHDNDIDVDVLVSENLDTDKIHSLFFLNNFRLGRKVYYKGNIQQLAYFNKTTNDIFDMIFWYPEGNRVVNYSERNFERSQDIKYFNLNCQVQFQGRSYPAPAPLEEWLVMRYGKDWRVPKTFKSDWKEECFDMKMNEI
jgi:phosphorylcholine metabolism protein LicD